MRIKISDNIFEKYPDLEISAIKISELNNQGENSEIDVKIKELVDALRRDINPEKLNEIPSIAKWRETYKSFGAKPSDFRNSAEALLKRILKKDLYKINKLVDLYNYISLKYCLTVGGEDIDSIIGDLVLDFANGHEEFMPLGETENLSPWQGEVIYKDNKGTICRCWNWREGDRTKLTKDTKNAVIVIENLLPEEKEKLTKAENEFRELAEKYCGCNCKIFRLNNKLREVEI
jgi:DNA/RNA-binding domain of Phe-tRNA-synthetase-like protein